MNESSTEIRLSSLEEPQIEAILLQLDNRELRILARRYLTIQNCDSRTIALQLSRQMDFTLLTKITLHYDRY